MKSINRYSILTFNPYSMFSRKCIRAKFHDYSGGMYFVTICAKEKKHYFGEISDNIMQFSEIGKIANKELNEIPLHYPYAEIPQYVVMPNHVHVIVAIKNSLNDLPSIRTCLGVIIGGYKQAVTRYARRIGILFEWQPRFHDHIIRGNDDCLRISDYIENNVILWHNDCFNIELVEI